MGPAAVLSIMVKAQGVQSTAGELRRLDKAGASAGSTLTKTEGHAKRAGKSFSLMGSAAKTAGVFIGGAGLAAGLKLANSEYREAQKVGAQTTAVIKSTGQAAKVTKKHVEDLSLAISKKSGIDDEAIQTGANLLLTFKGIRNEQGKGNKIFDQATQVITDMSVSMKQGLKPSAIQVGKALNDPVKGLTALGRVGVQFSDAQKKQITGLVEHGHKLEAQKILLRELKDEFAGSAAAQATAGDKLKVAWGNLAEAAGGILVPALDKVATFMTKVINQFVAGQGIARFVVPVFNEIKQSVQDLMAVLGPLIGFIGPKLVAGFNSLPAPIQGVAVALGILGTVLLVSNPLMAGLAALAGAAVLIHRNWSTISPIINSVRDSITAWVAKNQADIAVVMKAFNDVRAVVEAVFKVAFPVAVATAKRQISGLATAISGQLEIIKGVINVFLGVLHGDWARVWGGLKDIALGGLKAAYGAVKLGTAAFREIGSRIASAVIDGLSMLGHAILNKFKDAANFVIDNVGNLFKGVGHAITGGVGKINPFGDGVGKLPSGGKGSAALMGANSSLAPFASAGARFGLSVSSGLRPGAITSSGNVSYHSTGEAIDEAGPPAGMMAFFNFMKGTFGGSLAELIYGPGKIGIKDGQPFNFGSALNAQHMDHVHVALDTGKAGPGDGIGKAAGARKALTGDGPGKLGLQALANLWVKAGGSPKLAGLMARIAQAESGGDPGVQNASGATGLWQILGAMVKGNLRDPLTNARNAVAKYKSQGLGAWAASRGAWGKYVGHPGVSASEKAHDARVKAALKAHDARVAAHNKVNPFDQKIAAANVAIAQQKTTGSTKAPGISGRRVSNALIAAGLVRAKEKIVGARIKKIRDALKGKLTPATRLRLTQELAQQLDTHKQLDQQASALMHPAVGAAGGVGGGDVGGGDFSGDGGDPNQALIDSNAALQAAIEEQIATDKERIDLETQIRDEQRKFANVSQSQYGVLAKAIADVASGQIGGRVGLGLQTPGFAGGGSRY